MVQIALGQVRQLRKPFHFEPNRNQNVPHERRQLLFKRLAGHMKMLFWTVVTRCTQYKQALNDQWCKQDQILKTKTKFVCLGLTALSAQIGYIAP